MKTESKEIIYYAESFTFELFFHSVFKSKHKKIFLKDSVSFFNDNTHSKNIFEVIISKIIPETQIIRLPEYKFNEQELGKNGLCHKANNLTLKFAESDAFKNKLNNILNSYRESSKNKAISIAFKKRYLELIFQKILFYLILNNLMKKFTIDKIFAESIDIFQIDRYLNFHEINQDFQVKKNFIENCFRHLFFLFNPYLLRLILRRGINFFKINKKKFHLGIQLVWGLPPNTPGMDKEDFSNIVTDDELLKNKKINNSEVIFLDGKKFGRKKDTLREIEQKKYINNLGSSIVNEDEFKIPTKIFLNDIIIYSIKNFLLFRIWKKNYCGNLSTEKILQIIHCEYVENKITSKYLDIKVFVSRDDYDSSHITRTLIQNLNGNLNIGIQHSAFSYPHILPLQAYNYFDVYFTQGNGFERLWYPFWNLNKKNIAAGTQRAHLISKSRVQTNKVKQFNNKYKNKINILLLIGSTTSIHTPEWLYEMKYKRLDEIINLNKNINIILKPRFKNDAEDLFNIHPKLKKYYNSRIFIEDVNYTTQELISLVDIFVAEDNSSSILEAIHKEDLLAIGYRIRYPHQDGLNKLIMDSFNDLKLIISSFVKNKKLDQKYILDRNIIKKKYSLDPKISNWQRISEYCANISN